MESINKNSLGGGRYETPETILMDVQAEGVLCGSQGTGSVNPHEYGVWDWD